MNINERRIEKRALSVLDESNIDSFPVDLDSISASLGVTIRYEDLDDDVSGFLMVDSDNAVAVINNNHHSNRQRFTIAHEIGHFCLHTNNTKKESLFVDKAYSIHHRNKKSSTGTDKKEREANLFASILLMPESMVDEAVDDLELDFFNDEDIPLLAKKIGVSDQALGFRLARLEYEVGN